MPPPTRSQVIQRAVQWIGTLWGTRVLNVWPAEQQTEVEHWRELWQQVIALPEVQREPSYAGWLGDSILWNWVPVTFFAGLSTSVGSDTVSYGGDIHAPIKNAVP